MLNENWDKIDASDAENVKKVVGKGLSTEDYSTAEKSKLAGIEDNANNYQHPATHSPNIITQDENSRFVSDVEKNEWNAKETLVGAQNKADTAEQNAKDYVDSITTANEILTKIKTVDGVGSELDAEKISGVVTNITETAPTGTTRLNIEGELYATKIYNAVFNDYAEYFEKGKVGFEAGDILMINPSGVDNYVKSTGEYNTLVVGVVTDEYAFCIGGNGDSKDNSNFVPIGLAGRVSVKITGKINKGDLIVSSNISGVGMKADNKIEIPNGSIVGKALEDYDGTQGIKRIRMLIMNR